MGAWIETGRSLCCFAPDVSHPAWVRGLKRKAVADEEADDESHPAWVRGLKLYNQLCTIVAIRVAPRVGAWIETCLLLH